MQRFEYVIEVRDGSNKIFECCIPSTKITKRRLETLITVLAAKHGRLNDKEVVASLFNPNDGYYCPLLEINKRAVAPRFGWMCGQNPHVLVTSRPIQ